MHRSAHFPASPPRGFSLVEVVLALLVAATGLLAVFGIIPGALRQSQLARSDLVESGFGSAVLQAFGGNIRMIDDIRVWNDPEQFWAAATKGTGLEGEKLYTAKEVRAFYKKAVPDGNGTGDVTARPFSPMTTFVARDYPDGVSDDDVDVWYISREEKESQSLGSGLVVPAQYLIRLARIRRSARRVTDVRTENRTADGGSFPFDSTGGVTAPETDARPGGGASARLPNVYVISVVSTDRAWPDVFIREPVYSQEFTFVHRP